MKKIEEWIAEANSPDEEKFRQVIHMLLEAIARDSNLSRTLIIKGGIVMSLIHGGGRYTSDLDASSLDKPSDLTQEKLNTILSKQLKAVVATSKYNLDLKIHSIKPQSTKKISEASFPAYQVNIGYADRSKPKEIKHLDANNSTHVVRIDVSFNESVTIEDVEAFSLNGKRNVLRYTLEQMMAEKYRSLLQQPIRNRNRRQDVFDIYHLTQEYKDHLNNPDVKALVLDKLIKSAKGKKIGEYLHRKAMADPEIKERSLKDVGTLKQEIEIKHDYAAMYITVSEYFESLPWQ